jgi:putative phage-type endonuclease
MLDIIQGSDEWLALRVGKVTASRVADVIAKTKTGPSASRSKYLGELIAERLTGVPAERYTNAAMAWGTDTEPQARIAYEFLNGVNVEQIAFVLHPTIGDAGASPDGLVGDNGLVEIKCPETHTHIETLLGGTVPGKYVTQMMWQMACTGRQWCDFCSFDPRLPESMQFFCQRVHRDEEVIGELEKEVIAFLNEVREKVDQLRKRYEPAPLIDGAAELLMAG